MEEEGKDVRKGSEEAESRQLQGYLEGASEGGELVQTTAEGDRSGSGQVDG